MSKAVTVLFFFGNINCKVNKKMGKVYIAIPLHCSLFQIAYTVYDSCTRKNTDILLSFGFGIPQ